MIPHPDPLSEASYSAAELLPTNDGVVLLDQRKLPLVETYETLRTAEDVARAITDMVVRGAPAIGVAAAYGMVLAWAESRGDAQRFSELGTLMSRARPTAVNLAWAVQRMGATVVAADGELTVAELAREARDIHREDVAANRRLGAYGAEHLPDGATVLTHCNAGALATGGYGTALGVIRAARDAGKSVRVLADETRPYLQGARLTVWELMKDGIDVELIVDSAAASLFGRGLIDAVVVGADRVAANGDAANKIGTYSVACVAHAHQRPLYIAAPWSTIDLDCPDGSAIPIEERDAAEVSEYRGLATAPAGARVRNPSFDVTPARLIAGLFTERGSATPPSREELSRLGATES